MTTTRYNTRSRVRGCCALAACSFLLFSTHAQVQPVDLREATATFSQHLPTDLPYTVDQCIDDFIGDMNGWSVFPLVGQSHAAVFETASDVDFPCGSVLTFTLSQVHVLSGGHHTLGRFRVSATGDSRDTFADGRLSGGDVDANWSVLTPLRFTSTGGATMTRLPDDSILVSGEDPPTDVYIVVAHAGLRAITGIRVEALSDPSLPGQGPGRVYNGNFCLTEVQVVVEPLSSELTITVADVDVCWPSAPGRLYQPQYRPPGAAGAWVDLGEPVQGTGLPICIRDPIAGQSMRLYRVICLP